MLDSEVKMTSDWREEMKGMTSNKLYLQLLEHGPKSLSQSWILGALHSQWKRMKGITDPPQPDCQSSFKEWEKSIEKYQ